MIGGIYTVQLLGASSYSGRFILASLARLVDRFASDLKLETSRLSVRPAIGNP